MIFFTLPGVLGPVRHRRWQMVVHRHGLVPVADQDGSVDAAV